MLPYEAFLRLRPFSWKVDVLARSDDVGVVVPLEWQLLRSLGRRRYQRLRKLRHDVKCRHCLKEAGRIVWRLLQEKVKIVADALGNVELDRQPTHNDEPDTATLKLTKQRVIATESQELTHAVCVRANVGVHPHAADREAG